jgi:hypothetical protein
MYQVVQVEERIERLMEQAFATEPTEAGLLLDRWAAEGVAQEDMYLTLALASAKWIDHHGPWIGHGTLNMAPMIEAAKLLDERYKRLGLLQATVYVLELFRNKNYGPYLMPATEGVMRETAEETQQELFEYVADGTYPLLSENLFIGLYRQSGGDVRVPLLQLGLQEYGRNEHKLLIVLRTLDLLDQGDNWKYGENLLRPAVQYLAAMPKAPLAWQQIQAAWNTYGLDAVAHEFSLAGEVDEAKVADLLERLLTCEAGSEADLLAEELVNGTNVRTLYETIAQISAVLLMRNPHNEEHIVTGILCTLDMMRDERLPANMRLTALLAALASARTRDSKNVRAEWVEVPGLGASTSEGTEITAAELRSDSNMNVLADANVSDEAWLEQIEKSCEEDASGDTATRLAAHYITAGRDVTKLAQHLMQIVLRTQGPFMAIHLVKMIWGQWKETQFSTSPNRWVHLASAARFAARTIEGGRKGAERVVKQW